MSIGISRKWAACAAFALLFGAFARPALAQKDRILLKDGKEKSANVISEDFDGVRFSVDGGSTGMAWKLVDSIRYTGAEKYYKAIDTFALGKLAEALPLLEALGADTKARPVIRHGVLYHLGLTYQRLGKPDQAIATYEELLKAFPKSRYVLAVGTNLLSAYTAKGDLAGAARALDTSMAAAQSGGNDPNITAGFDLLRGRILEEQKKFTEASALYERTAKTPGGDADMIAAARLGVARCADRAGQKNEAEKLYRELVTQDAPNNVLAGAWNGIGDIALETGTSKRESDTLREALFAYLRGVVLYGPGRDGLSDEYERSLAGAYRAFRGIGELESNAERKKLFLDRARQLKDQLATGYSDSRFLKGL